MWRWHLFFFFLCPTRVSCWLIHLHISLPTFKFTIPINPPPPTTTSIASIPAVCRTSVIHELSQMTPPSMSSRSSADRAPARCSGGHGLDSCRGPRTPPRPTPMSCWLIHLHISLLTFKFTIFINLSLLTMTAIPLILAVCRTPVIYSMNSVKVIPHICIAHPYCA